MPAPTPEAPEASPPAARVGLLRVLHEITSLGPAPNAECVPDAIARAATALGVTTGAVGRIEGDHYSSVWVHPDGGPVLPGQRVRVSDTYATLVLALDRTVAYAEIGTSPHRHQAFYRRQRFETYLGTEILVDGRRYGVLDFMDGSARQEPFDEMEIAFVELLADWVGWTLERGDIGHRLRRSDDEIQRMYHTLCHELKTPLTSMREFLSLVLDEIARPLRAEQREYLEEVRAGTDDLTRHVNDLIDVSRLDTGKLACHPKPTDITDVVGRAVGLYRRELDETGLHLDVHASGKLPLAIVDTVRISQVLRNLLANAIRFTPAGGTVRIDIRPDTTGKWIAISLRDTGLGIATEHLARVFDRLYQITEGEWATQGGLGLGLHLARELVRLHGGDIWVESDLGSGTTFTFTVPAQIAQSSGIRRVGSHT